jgi:tetratricopeptide (TPR) repeat protein
MPQDDPPDATSPDDKELTTQSFAGDPDQAVITGRYKLFELLGAGGMGEVYRAEQTQPIERTVAVKVIKSGMDTKQVIARFEAERQALALMDHPNIARVFDAGSTPQARPYFVMEYVKGVPITNYCDTQKLTTRSRLELFMQLCEGVQHAHQKAIIHRDLKPSNVLVAIQDDKPVPKIIDFGVAKATARKLTEKTAHTALGELIGTPEYMSPEQAEMTGADVDTRTDVYALGVILYELLVGALPFDPRELRKAGFEGILRMIREQDPARPSTKVSTLGERSTEVAKARRTVPDRLRVSLRGDLDWITMKALEKDRTRRYGSAADLESDVRRHLRHEPVLASPPSAAYRMRKFARRNRIGVTFAAVVVTLLAGLALTMTVQAGRIARERDRANVEAERATAEADRANREAETSDQVSEFLVSVFNVSDPNEARGNVITAREVLDNGAMRIQRELKDQVLLRAKMMGTMGRVYQNLGLFPKAESLLVGALDLRQAKLGREHLETIESLSDLGWLRFWQGELDEARSMHEQALSVRERELGPEHVDTAYSLYYLASTHLWGGDPAGSFALLERALPILERELGPEHQVVAWCVNDIARALQRMGDHAAGLQYDRRALKIKKNTLGEKHPDVGMAYNNVGHALMTLGRLDEARPYLETSLAIVEKALGPNHFWVATVLDTWGDLSRQLGDYEGARTRLQRALQILEVSVGPEQWAVPLVLENLALVAQESGNHAEADSLFQRTVGIHEKINPDHVELAQALERYAALLRSMEQVGEAEAMEVRAKAIREKHEQQESVN